jgi:uncharacterized protein (TIGR02646 family)
MRPVNKGTPPRQYTNYQDASPDLKERLGRFCSYCERRIPVGLAVEHISPKSTDAAHLLNWYNFLLACQNCNSVKLDTPTNPVALPVSPLAPQTTQNVPLDFPNCLFPDHDNTFLALRYKQGGFVEADTTLPPDVKAKVDELIKLVGLDRHGSPQSIRKPAAGDDRWKDRDEEWDSAEQTKTCFDDMAAGLPQARAQECDRVATQAAARGHFSIWMTVFEDTEGKTYADVRQAIIGAFPGTATDCFHPTTHSPIPRPGGHI